MGISRAARIHNIKPVLKPVISYVSMTVEDYIAIQSFCGFLNGLNPVLHKIAMAVRGENLMTVDRDNFKVIAKAAEITIACNVNYSRCLGGIFEQMLENSPF